MFYAIQLAVCAGLLVAHDLSAEAETGQRGLESTASSSSNTTCGRRNPQGVHKHITGLSKAESQFGEFPWTAAVLRIKGDKLVLVCAASLITPSVLVTAAHNVDGATDLVVRLGEWDTQHVTEAFPHVDIKVNNIKIHESYNKGNKHNDIALLYLASEAPLQEHIGTICLPDKNIPLVYSAVCFSSGWGKDTFDGTYSLLMKKVSLPLVEPNVCQDLLRKTRLGRWFRLDISFACAGGVDGNDTCTGDGGGPLACPDPSNPDRYVLGGAVSWGIGCGTINVPGVYVNISYFVDWIYANL